MDQLSQRRKLLHRFKESARSDPYRTDSKPQGIPQCSICKSLEIKGRWYSEKQAKSQKFAPLATSKKTCPACQQTKEGIGLGFVEMKGDRWRKNFKLVASTIQNAEKIARSRNDQERIIRLEQDDKMTRIVVTLPTLARKIGRSLGKAFQGKVTYDRTGKEPFLHVVWESDLPRQKHRPGAHPEAVKMLKGKSRAFRKRSIG